MKWEGRSEKSVREYYLTESRRMVETISENKLPRVLKTDLYNEAIADPAPGGIIGNLGIVESVSGVEFDTESLQKAQAALPGIDLRQGDIRELPFCNDAFELVIDLSTLDHIHPEEMEKVIREYCRVLVPGGFLFLVVWCWETYFYGHPTTNWNPRQQHFAHVELLTDIIKRNGFEIQERDLILKNQDVAEQELWQFVAKKGATWILPD